MPYPCCCKPAPLTTQCSACGDLALPGNILSPLRLQANLPGFKVYRRAGFNNPWELIQTFPAATTIFTNRDFLVGAVPQESCCWAMPFTELCVRDRNTSGTLQNRLAFGGSIGFARFSSGIWLGDPHVDVRVAVGLYEEPVNFFSQAALQVVASTPSYNCFTSLESSFDPDSRRDNCEGLRDSPVTVQIPPRTLATVAAFDCGTYTQFGATTDGGAVQVTWL